MGDRQTILIVDDEPFSLKMLHQAFSGHYRVLFATSGEDALRIVAREVPDLIVLDVMMPRMTGYELLGHFKKDERLDATPVVFLTANDQWADEKIGLEMGAADYWAKPVNFDIARIRARNHLELKRHRDTLARLALTDGLCGILNRRGFDQAIEREWWRALRAGTVLSLLLADIDHFKVYNDTYGHPAGDACLQRVSAAISQELRRPGDCVARYGGEEFACILPATEPAGALVIADRLRTAVAAMPISGSHITISIGLASLVPDRSKVITDLVALADNALYTAKRDGRNRVVEANLHL